MKTTSMKEHPPFSGKFGTVAALLSIVSMAMIAKADPTSSSASFTLLSAEPGVGGGTATSATYSVDTATGSAIAGGVSNVTPGGVQAKGGYTGQLYDGVSMVLSASPSTTVDAGGSTQLSATVTLDDETTLTSGTLTWEALSGPFAGIDVEGSFTAGYPNTASTARVRGTFDLLAETIDLSIVPLPVDPYSFSLDELGGSGAPYRVFFGTTPDSLTENNPAGSSFSPGNLTPGQTYFWQAFDGTGANITPGGDGPVRFLAGANVELVQIGHPGNAPDSTGFGAVANDYWMGKLEVTNRQYADFLNAVAATDPNGLFEPQMESDPRGGIARFGPPGDYTYAPKAKMADKPVNFVAFWSVARYCNWLHNGLPVGDQSTLTTESGAYDLTDSSAITANSVTRAGGAQYYIPDNNEWDKAAYFDPRPAAQNGPPGDDNYWLYPTVSDSPPTAATADMDGNIDNDTDPIANFDSTADWNGQDGSVTSVGSGGPGSASYFGNRDMAGNVRELLEDIDGLDRVTRGGDFGSPDSELASSDIFANRLVAATGSSSTTGFRVAALAIPLVPPPAALPPPVNTALKASLNNKLKKLKKKFKKAKKSGNSSKAKKLKKKIKKFKKKIKKFKKKLAAL